MTLILRESSSSSSPSPLLAELEGVYAQVERAREIERPFLEIVPQANLTPQERRVVDLWDQNLTQVVIADRLEISQPRVHQLEQAAILKLRAQAEKWIG